MNSETSKKSKFLGGLTLFITAILLNGCYNDTIVPRQDIVVTSEVSFSQDIQPIFDASCNGAGCHNNGGIAPNLTAGASLGALNGGGYISTQNPESSELYQWMLGNRDVDMPPSGPMASANAKVLAWIKQGALNN